MCGYVKENLCAITNTPCPYMYYCTKIQAWKANASMPANCKVKQNLEVPNGYCRVREERKGYLYVDVDNQTIKISNPFDNVPLFVKVSKTKTGEYRVKK